MALVGDEVVPAARREQVGDVGELLGAEGVEILLPAGDEAPVVGGAEELAGGAAKIGPVGLVAEDFGGAGEGAGIVLAFVGGLDEEGGHGRDAGEVGVVGVEDFEV